VPAPIAAKPPNDAEPHPAIIHRMGTVAEATHA
jgi:hypothetical protein